MRVGYDTPIGSTTVSHLGWLGIRGDPTDTAGVTANDLTNLRFRADGHRRHFDGAPTVVCAIRGRGAAPGWNGSDAERFGQAVSGLMAVHGRATGGPRRLGLDVCTFAAEILASQAILAALIGQRRGCAVRGVETSLLDGAWMFLLHHIAAATSPEALELPPLTGDVGPPFPTADGSRVEIEALMPDSWRAFWEALGAGGEDLDAAWLRFAFRHNTAHCALPRRLHEATRSRTVDEICEVGASCGVAICRVRGYADLLTSQAVESRAAPPWRVATPPRRTNGNDVQLHEPARSASGSNGPGGAPLATSGPLGGLRVIEVTSRIQGPLAGRLLAMLGAEVIRVEPPGGDVTRMTPPMAGTDGAAFVAYNHGKRSVEIDLRSAGGRGELMDLMTGADVFLNNWRPGRAESLGLHRARLARTNPALVYAHASGWTGAFGEVPSIATDYLVQAHAAVGEGLSPAGEPGVPSCVTLIDVIGGLVACEGILAALWRRDELGGPISVETSLWSGAMALQRPVIAAIANDREDGREMGRPQMHALDQPLRTADGFIVVSTTDGATRCRFRTVASGGPDDDAIAARIADRPTGEWLERLGAAGVPAEAVCDDLAQLVRDPRTRDGLASVDGADGCSLPLPPWRFTA